MSVAVAHLVIPRGTDFGPYGWVLLDGQGHALTDPAGVHMVAKIRRHRDDLAVAHAFTTHVGAIAVPGYPEVVVCGLITATAAETGAWTFLLAEYDVLVNGKPVVGGQVSAPLAVSR